MTGILLLEVPVQVEVSPSKTIGSDTLSLASGILSFFLRILRVDMSY
jgi:hypothetical protein